MTLCFSAGIAASSFTKPSSQQSLCLRPSRRPRPAARPSRGAVTASAVAPAALSARGQELLEAYMAAPLYAAPAGAADAETAAVLRGGGVGPAAFAGAFDEMVGAARAAILADFPGITGPGGALHPASRADACWRDLRQFLALAAGVAYCGGQVRDSALPVLRALYAELAVPLLPMRAGLFVLKGEAAKRGAPPAAAVALDKVAGALV